MHFDSIISPILTPNNNPPRPIKLTGFIKKKFHYVKNSKELIVFIPPWHARLKDNNIIQRTLLKQGCSFLEYAFSPKILSVNHRLTLKCFRQIKKEIKQNINQLKKKYKFKKIKILGISLGCVNACMIANDNKNISELSLILPGHCLAESMWQGLSTKKLRQQYEEEGVTLPQLKKYWKELAPENNIAKLSAKKIYVHLSQADAVIPYYCGKILKDKLNKKYKIIYKENKHLGHYLTAVLFHLLPKKL